ncbi:MAG: histidine kinase [Eubacteriales bacterium]|nr:histidine kinase [Eubacteriales bacterium]
MKKFSFHSLRTNMTVFLLAFLLLLISVISYNNYAAFSLLRKNVYANTMDTLTLYQKHLDERLTQTRTYLLATSSIDSNGLLNTLSTSTIHDTEWFSALYRLDGNFDTALSTYTANCFFCYLPNQNQFIQSYDVNASEANLLKETLVSRILSEDVPLGQWFLCSAGDSYYFSYVLYIRNTYVGSWISMERLLNTVSGSSQSNNAFYFATDEGELLRDGQESLFVTAPAEKKSPYASELVEEARVLSVFHSLEEADLCLTVLVPESDLTDHYYSMANAILLVLISILLAWLAMYLFLTRRVVEPISALTKGITELRSGNLSAYVPLQKQPDELLHMTQAFNDMVAEIKDLKIDAYERKLRHQRLETQFLKQQITPHFMINCLNTAYQLTETNHPDLARKMLKNLSSHLRYTLSSGQTVALSEEIALLKNYIELSGIRYPGCISLFLSCPDELLNATAIPLLLLTFVENTIKYEVSMGELLEIHVEITEHAGLLTFCLWDTGNGFSPKFLEKLQDLDTYVDTEDYHIGIVNVVLRARYVYKDSAFSFTNRPGAGAQITMTLPYLPYNGNPKGGTS